MAINWGRALMEGTSGAVSGRRDLAIAERLKKEAEARDLSSRQTLAGEAFGREKELRLLLDKLQAGRDTRLAETEGDERRRRERLGLRSQLSEEYGVDAPLGATIEDLSSRVAGARSEQLAQQEAIRVEEKAREDEEFRLDKISAELGIRLKNLQIQAAESSDPALKVKLDIIGRRGDIIREELDALDQEQRSLGNFPSEDVLSGIKGRRDALILRLRNLNDEYVGLMQEPDPEPNPSGETSPLLDEVLRRLGGTGQSQAGGDLESVWSQTTGG